MQRGRHARECLGPCGLGARALSAAVMGTARCSWTELGLDVLPDGECVVQPGEEHDGNGAFGAAVHT